MKLLSKLAKLAACHGSLMHGMHSMHHRKSMLSPGLNTAHEFSAAHGLNAYHESNDVMKILNVLQCLHCRSFMHCMHMLHCKTLGCSCSMSNLFTFCICVQLVHILEADQHCPHSACVLRVYNSLCIANNLHIVFVC